MLQRTKDIEDFKLCIKLLSEYFTETFDYTLDDFNEENIHLLINNPKTAFFILRFESDLTHYDFGFIIESERGKGLGTIAIKEIIEYSKEISNNPIRATVRVENISSYKTMLKNSFIVDSTFMIGSSIGVSMFYDFTKKVDIEKYLSTKPSSCGLTVLSALSDLKYNQYVSPDSLNIPCIPNRGIPKETMIQGVMALFKDYTFKVISNYTTPSEDVWHLFEQHFLNRNSYAIACVKEDLSYGHWMLVTKYDGTFVYTIDSIYKQKQWTKFEFFSKFVQSNMFAILL